MRLNLPAAISHVNEIIKMHLMTIEHFSAYLIHQITAKLFEYSYPNQKLAVYTVAFIVSLSHTFVLRVKSVRECIQNHSWRIQFVVVFGYCVWTVKSAVCAYKAHFSPGERF